MVKVRRFSYCEGEMFDVEVISLPSFSIPSIKKLVRSEAQQDDEEDWSDEDFFSNLDIQRSGAVVAVHDTEYGTGSVFYVKM